MQFLCLAGKHLQETINTKIDLDTKVCNELEKINATIKIENSVCMDVFVIFLVNFV